MGAGFTPDEAFLHLIENAKDAEGKSIPVKALPDLLNAVEPSLRIDKWRIYDILSGRTFPRLREIAAFVTVCHGFSPLDAVEQRVGRVGVLLPTSVDLDDVAVRCAEVAMREFGDVLREVGEAAKDGKYTEREAATVDKQADEAIAAIHAVKRQIRALVAPKGRRK